MHKAMDACPNCTSKGKSGDLYLDYKKTRGNQMYKCLQCSMIFRPHEVNLAGKEIIA